MGSEALRNNTTGANNTAVGANALDSNTEGTNTVAIGFGALTAQNTGGTNTGVGYNALAACTVGYYSAAFGAYAGDNMTTGHSNTYIGDNAGNTHATGYGCTIIGRASNTSATDVNLETVVGHSITGKGTQTFFAGGNAGAYNEENVTVWRTTSDRRIKKNITNNTIGLDKINQITVRNFEYRTEDEIITDAPELTDVIKSAVVNKEGVQVGSIAQEIEEILPDLVKTNEYGIKSVNTNNLTWYMINAIKELSAEHTALKSRLDAAGL